MQAIAMADGKVFSLSLNSIGRYGDSYNQPRVSWYRGVLEQLFRTKQIKLKTKVGVCFLPSSCGVYCPLLSLGFADCTLAALRKAKVGDTPRQVSGYKEPARYVPE